MRFSCSQTSFNFLINVVPSWHDATSPGFAGARAYTLMLNECRDTALSNGSADTIPASKL